MLKALLKLVGGSSDLPTSLIPEICLFVSGHKPLLRFVCQQETRRNVKSFAVKFGLYIAEAKIYSHYEGTTWSSTRVALETSKVEDPIDYLVIISSQTGLAKSVIDWELEGVANLAGLALGYPECCVKAYQKVCKYTSRWGLYYFDRDGAGPHEPWANRLTIGWGGVSPIGELYPCSLRCPSAIRIGRLALSLLQEYKLIRLYDNIEKHANQNVFISQEGDIFPVGDFSSKSINAEWVEVQFNEK